MTVTLKIVTAAIILNFVFLNRQHAEAGHEVTLINKKPRQPECYCFNRTHECESAYFEIKKTWFRVDKMDPFLLMPNFEIKQLDDEKKMDQGKLYYLLPENFTEKKLELYGGWLSNFLKFGNQSIVPITGYRNASEAPMIITGDEKTLFYHNKNNSTNTRNQQIRFFKDNWLKLDENENLVLATTEDIMTVLAHLQGVFIRSPYYSQTVDWKKFYMFFIYRKIEILGSLPSVLHTSSIGKCVNCPVGFFGNYCEKYDFSARNNSKRSDKFKYVPTWINSDQIQEEIIEIPNYGAPVH